QADSRADQAAQREDADGAECGGPGAAPLLEAKRLEHVVLVDVLQVLEGLEPLPPDVLDHDGLQERPPEAAHHVNAVELSPAQSAHEPRGMLGPARRARARRWAPASRSARTSDRPLPRPPRARSVRRCWRAGSSPAGSAPIAARCGGPCP